MDENFVTYFFGPPYPVHLSGAVWRADCRWQRA